MPENLRALIVIIALVVPIFWLARAPVCELAMSADDFGRRRNLWLFVTVLSFLGHNFWIYASAAAVALAIAGARETNRLGLYLFVLFAVPPFSMQVPGFAGINYLIDVNHVRLLSIVLLLPAYLALRREEQTLPFGRSLADKMLVGYLLLQLAMQAPVDTATNTLRSTFYAFTDVFLPYYVASRTLRDLQACRDTAMSFVFAALLMAPIAAFEYAKHWLLYAAVPGGLGVPFGMGSYLTRGDSLRALASTGHSIILGYVMMVTLALYAFARRSLSNNKIALLALAVLLLGLLAPVSRGPWVGAAAALAVMLLTGPDKLSRIARFASFALPLGAVVLVSPLGDKIIDVLPFVGTVDEVNVIYRQRLFEVSVGVLMMHPIFGSFDYLSAPAMQEMIQGEGIIDMVNSYLSIAMSYGFVGLALFVAVFLAAAWGVWRGIGSTQPGSELNDLGRALLAAVAGTLVTIATMSSILTIPTVYWLLAGFCVGYAQLTQRQSSSLSYPPMQEMVSHGPRV